MPSTSLIRVRARSWQAGALAVVLAATLATVAHLATVAYAQEEPPDDDFPGVECPEFAGEPAAEDEFTAYQYALACGVDIEVLGLREPDRQVFATPDGLLDAEIAIEPYWVPDGSGDWVDIDPTLVGQGDGSAVAAATVIDIAVGAGGGDTFVTATDRDGGSLTLTWPYGELPAPVLDGPVATFPEVLPGVDLAVQAEPVGFAWVLVVKTAAAAANPVLAEIAIGIDTVGLEVAENPDTGGIEVIDGSGAVIFETGQAIMWDSSVAGGEGAAPAGVMGLTEGGEEPPADPGRIGEVQVAVTGSGLDLTPDAAMLADETVTFPLYIDPPFTSTRQAWANVYDGAKSRGWTGDSSWPRAGGMRVGRNTWHDCGDGCGVWRSAITVKIGKLKGTHIASASVRALQTHTGGCGSYGLQLWRTQKISNGVSWNGVTWLYGSPLQSRSVASSNSIGGCGSANPNRWVAFDNAEVRKRVQSAADQRYETISFGLRSSSESDRNAWRRIQTSSVKLHVTYYLYPPKPDQLKLNGESCKTSLGAAPWVTSRTPTLSARARSHESESVYLRMRIRNRGADSNYWYYRTPSTVASYTTVNRRVTKSLPDGEYTWQARTDARQSASINSGYTGHCYFKVDATKPTVPSVSAPSGPFTEGQNVALSVSATDPLVNGVRSGMARFEYSWTTPIYDRSLASTGSATITRSNAPAGRHVLYVRAVDRAGNISNERTHTFFVGRDIPATAMGMWRFEGEVFDDSGHGYDLTMARGAGPVLGTDREGRPDAALELDGSSCLTGPAPIRTDAAFSVALWVRMDEAPASYAKVLTQGNTVRSAYQIQYQSSNNRWYFSLLTAPEGDFSWKSLGAVNPAGMGQWLHIAATFDPDAGLQRLYFNGRLAAEQAVDFEPWNGKDTFGVGCLRQASGSTGHFLTGAVDRLGLWQGLLTPAQIRAAMKDLPGSAELARWEFRNAGEDSSRYGRQLEIPDHLETGADAYNRPNGAIELDGQTCLEHPDSGHRPDRSWSIAAWVKVGDADGQSSVVSTVSETGDSGLTLSVRQVSASQTRFELEQFRNANWPSLNYFGDIELNQWYHVAVSYDLNSQSLLLYLDGEVASALGKILAPVPSGSAVLVGCANVPAGNGAVRGQYLDGSLHDVRIWRGAVSEVEIAAMMGNPPAELGGRWRLDGWGTDTSGHDHDLTFEGDTQFNDGWSCDPDGALELAGAGHAGTAGPVVATDESFTVSAWARVDTLTESASFVTAAGHQNTSFRLSYEATTQKFQFIMTSGDVPSSAPGFQWHIARGGPTPEVDTWYHLVGVFDLYEGEIRFYVTGQLAATAGGPASPWRADGPLLLGASGTIDGNRWNLLHGAVDDVVVWQGAVPDHIFGQISAAPVPKC